MNKKENVGGSLNMLRGDGGIALLKQFFSDSIQPQPAFMQNFRRNTLFFTKDSEQKVLGADMPVIQAFRLFGSVRQDSLTLVRKR